MSRSAESYILTWPDSWHNALVHCFLHILCWKQQEYSERRVLFSVCKALQQWPHRRTVSCPVRVWAEFYNTITPRKYLQTNTWYLLIFNTAREVVSLLPYLSSFFFTSKTTHPPMRFFQVSRTLAITRTSKTGKQGRSTETLTIFFFWRCT